MKLIHFLIIAITIGAANGLLIDNNTIAYYSFNTTGFSQANSFPVTLALNNSATWISNAKNGGGISLTDGNINKINLSNALNITADVTVAFWIYPINSYCKDSTQIFGRRNGVVGGSWGTYYSWLKANCTIDLYLEGNSVDSAAFRSRSALATQKWSHIAFTYNNSTKNVILYINGEVENLNGTANSTYAAHGLYYGGSFTTYFGGGTPGTTSLNETIDQVLISARAYSQKEIQALYNGGAGCEYYDALYSTNVCGETTYANKASFMGVGP